MASIAALSDDEHSQQRNMGLVGGGAPKHTADDAASMSSSEPRRGTAKLVCRSRPCGHQLGDALALLHQQFLSLPRPLLDEMAEVFPSVGPTPDSKRKAVGLVSGLLKINVNTVRAAIAGRRVAVKAAAKKRRRSQRGLAHHRRPANSTHVHDTTPATPISHEHAFAERRGPSKQA